MTSGPLELLKVLASGVRAVAPERASSGVEHEGFESLLSRAKAGTISSGERVTEARSAGVNLTPEQLDRLAVAADRAEAEGAQRALVLIDGKVLKMDVQSRTITGAADPAADGVHANYDTVITVAAADRAAKGVASSSDLLRSLGMARAPQSGAA